jgi:hypothetical protein
MRARAPRFLLPSLVTTVLLTLAFACGTQEVSIPDAPPPPDSGPPRDAAGDTALVDSPPGDAPIDAPDVVCPDVLPDDDTGVFVSTAGTNDVACGTRAKPCKTVNVGITHANAASKAKVYVARGTYVERVALAANVEVIGGWDVPAGSTKWRRTCVTPEQIVVLRAPAADNVTVEARDLGGEAKLSLVRVESNAAAQVQPGESLYGVVAIGGGTTLALDAVDVEVGAAGAGISPPKGAAGSIGPVTCAPGPGGAGTPGTAGTGATIGAYDPTGYTPAVATPGNLGTPGNNGLAGGPGECLPCGKCDPLNACALIPDPTPTCGKDGQPGCGGGPGAVGAPGTGGGSSIAIYAWDATVTVNGGKAKSGDAGSGGAGGLGGNGGAPTGAAVGAPADACVVKCDLGIVPLTCIETKKAAAGGTAGTAGGPGGAGGVGGGGGGGSSFAVYAGGIGVVTTTGGVGLAHGKAGAGGGSGPAAGAPGAAADHVP